MAMGKDKHLLDLAGAILDPHGQQPAVQGDKARRAAETLKRLAETDQGARAIAARLRRLALDD